MRKRILAYVLIVMAFLALALPVAADGIIIPIPIPPRPPEPLRSLAIKYHRVTVSIDEQVATTHVEQVFVNELPYDIEGEYVFPIPEGASVSQFAMWVDGAKLEAQILDRDEASRIYEDIVRERRDPALLEYAGRGAFRARVFPIPAHGEKKIELEYTEVLPRDGDLVRYVYPLNTEKFSTRPLEEVSVAVSIAASQGVSGAYSPSHEVVAVRQSPQWLDVGYEENDVTPDRDFVLYYTVAESDLALNVLSFKPEGEDGFFLLLLNPKPQQEDTQVVAKDVFFVLDTSGSMRGDKLEQARNAARYVLENLNRGDRFNLIVFSTAVRTFAEELQSLDQRDEALAYLRGQQAGGGTNIARALETTLDQVEKGRPQVVVFLTDGLATEGETNSGKILAQVAEQAPEELRLFTFGVGYDVNTTLLDTLAQEHRGVSSYVRPEEDIEQAVSSFYEKISSPVFTSVQLDMGAARAEEIYPDPLPDLFAGGQIVAVGRYRHTGDTTVTLTGEVHGKAQVLRFPDVRLRASGGPDFIARLWATRKIGYLLTQIRLHGTNRELVDEIIALSVRYGIVTPYTSFLVDETEDALSDKGREAIANRALSGQGPSAPALGFGGAAPAAESGQIAVEKSLGQTQLRQADVAAAPHVEQVRVAGDRAFVLRDEVWTDTLYPAGSKTEKLALGSERYLELVRANPELGRYLALGERVIVMWHGQAIEVLPDGAAGVPQPRATAQPAPTRAPAPTLAPPTLAPRPSAAPTQPSFVTPPTAAPMPTPEPTPAPEGNLWDTIAAWLRGLLLK